MPGPAFSPFQMIGIVYAFIFFLLGAYLWRKRLFSRKLWYLLLVVSALLGFLIFSPVLPFQFQELILQLGGGSAGFTIIAAAIGIALFLLLTYLFGRQFCSYLCPVGAVQELAHAVPGPKVPVRAKVTLTIARWIVFIIIIIAGIGFSTGILAILGLRQFFTLTLSFGFLVFLGILVISVFIYRPFCRVICPVAVFFQMAAAFSRWKIRRTPACIECGKCEKACPTGEAGKKDRKSESYLCRRCMEVCPKEDALLYGPPGEGEGPAGGK